MTSRRCYDYPLRPDTFTAQVVVPGDMTRHEAERVCAFIMTLAQPLSVTINVTNGRQEMNEELKWEVIAMMRIWLMRLEYSDPHNDKPGVRALLKKLEATCEGDAQ